MKLAQNLILIAALVSSVVAFAKGKKPSVDDIKLDDEPAQTKAEPAVSHTEKIPDAVLLALSAADQHEKDRDYNAVVTTLKPKIDKMPRKGLLQLARAYRLLKDLPNETHMIELCTAKDPKDYVAQSMLGVAYTTAHRNEDAATAFDAAIEQNPKYRPAYEGKWALLEGTGELYEARTTVTDMIKIFGPDAKTTAGLCRLYSGGDFLEKSIEVCKQAISVDAKNPDNYVYLTMSLRDTDKKDEAGKTISEAAQRFPASENVQDLAGDLKANDKVFGESYRYYTAAVKANPKSAKAQLGLAKSAYELQKHDEAIAAFSTACKLDHKYALDFRQAASQLRKNNDAKWMKYQSAAEDVCD